MKGLRSVATLRAGLLAALALWGSAGAQTPTGTAIAPPVGSESVRLEKSVQIPMRDGVHLSTDIYFPEGGDAHRPVILIRTPYGKQGWRQGNPRAALTTMFATHGYIVAIQDKRGRFESQGRYTLAIDEDGQTFAANAAKKASQQAKHLGGVRVGQGTRDPLLQAGFVRKG